MTQDKSFFPYLLVEDGIDFNPGVGFGNDIRILSCPCPFVSGCVAHFWGALRYSWNWLGERENKQAGK